MMGTKVIVRALKIRIEVECVLFTIHLLEAEIFETKQMNYNCSAYKGNTVYVWIKMMKDFNDKKEYNIGAWVSNNMYTEQDLNSSQTATGHL